MEPKKIIDINRTADDNFNSIFDSTQINLNEAIKPFMYYWDYKAPEEFIRLAKYEYTSLLTTTVYSLINILAIIYSEGLPIREITKRMSNVYTDGNYDEPRNKKRLERIYSDYLERNQRHSAYLNSPEFKPRLMASDAIWYDLISDFPIIKRFLHKEISIITKEFFNELNLVYEHINTYNGYDRYFLMHKLEQTSHLNIFCKTLSLIKKEKRKRKLSDLQVKQLIDGLTQLQLIPYNHPEFSLILAASEHSNVFDEISNINCCELTINNIVFNIDDLINYYIKYPTFAGHFVIVLNFFHNAVVFHLSEQIHKELSIDSNLQGLKLIDKIQHCDAATKFFDKDINSNIPNYKEFAKDITFTHFKRIYKIKTEK